MNFDNDNLIKNRYIIKKHIGDGSFADVFLAIDNINSRKVALKVLKKAVKETDKQRFKVEAESLTRVSHKNVVKLYEEFIDPSSGRHVIVMEYVDGKNIKQEVERTGFIETNKAMHIALQLVKGVRAIEKAGIIHRDIKPQNINITYDNEVKLMDFGIARIDTSLELTAEKNVIGSVMYIAPEIFKSANVDPSKRYSTQTEIYAIGAVIFYMLAGEAPFTGEDIRDIMVKTINEKLPKIKAKNETVPADVFYILKKSTSKNLTIRYKTFDEFISDIQSVIDGEKIESSHDSLEEKKVNKKSLLLLNDKKTMIMWVTILSVLFISLTGVVIWSILS